MKTLNEELSPFKDNDTRQDPVFVRKMLEHYRLAEDFSEATTDKQIYREDKKVHHYLKVMESGEKHADAQMLKELHEGTVKQDDEKLRKYLVSRLKN